MLVYSPVRNERRSRTSPTTTSPRQKPATESQLRDRRQHVTSSDLHQSKQQQVRVVSQQAASGGVSGAVVGGPSQHATREQLASDESAATAPRKVRTVVCDDDYEDMWNAATVARNLSSYNTSAPRQSPQVSSLTHRFCRAMLCISAALCRRALSVRLCVCHVRVFCRKSKHVFEFFSPHTKPYVYIPTGTP